MKDLSAAERRLIAALDRLNDVVERAGHRIATMRAATPAPHTLTAAAPQGDGAISPQVAALRDRQAATLEAMQLRLSEAHERLAETGEQAARLAAANDELARANRALVTAAASPEAWSRHGETATLTALQAEVEALRAARAAEVAQMGGILDALDRMLGVAPAPRSVPPSGDKDVPADEGAAAPLPVAQHGGTSPDDPLPEDEDEDEDESREPSVLSDEDPLPEDEPAPAFGDEDLPPRGKAVSLDVAETEKEPR